MKPRRPIPRATPQRKKELAKYRRLKVKFLKTHRHCAMCHLWVFEQYRQLHHFYGRTGDLLCWVPGFRLLDKHCHEWVEAHRNEAVKLGLRAPDNLFNRPSLIIPK